jgi:heme-degrading monooxygenase HmoA
MIVKVFIKRRIKDGKEKEAFSLLKKIRYKAMNFEGYISGETLMHTEDTHKIMILSTWQSLENWNDWVESKDRNELDSRLEELQVEPATYEPYVFSKYRISVQQQFPEPLD